MVGQIAPADRVTQNGHWEKGRLGGFGITYEAEDIGLGTMVAIKEYYPFDFADRDSS